MNPLKGGWAIALTTLIAVLLVGFDWRSDWPVWVIYFFPNWLVIIVFYWSINKPTRVNIFSIWVLGFVVDALLNEPFGLNGLCLIIVVYLACQLHEGLHSRYLGRRMIVLGILVFGVTTIKHFTLVVTSDIVLDPYVLTLPVIGSCLAWAPIAYVLDLFDERFVET